MAGTSTQLSAVAPLLLPPTITDPIFNKATEQSAVMALAQRVPLAVNAQTAIPVFTDIPRAGWVSEGQAKPVGGAGVGVKTMIGKKLALILPVSQEVAMTNPAALYTHLSSVLPTALARSFDYAAIHGLDFASGNAGPFTSYLAQTPYMQTIGSTSATNGGVYTDLVKGVQQVVNGSMPYDFTGFAADPRLKPELMLSIDLNGRPLLVDAYPNANTGNQALNQSLVGYPVAYNAGVSGKYRYSGDQVQTITVTATGGTYTLTVGGYTTPAIAYNANAATIQAALTALAPGTPYGGGSGVNATVTGTGPYTVTFLAGQAAAPITANGAALTGGTVTVAQSPVQDTGLRAIGGDWSQCAYGVGMDIQIRISNEASYVDAQGNTVSAFQNNLLLLLAEAYFGFVVNDPTAFVQYTHAVGS